MLIGDPVDVRNDTEPESAVFRGVEDPPCSHGNK